MRTIHTYRLAFAAAAALGLAVTAAAEEKNPAVLNALEVRQLVARAEPGDHVRLGAHFAALGDRYAAEAARHTEMSRSFVGNPNRNIGTGMSAHCTQLAKLNTDSATTVRELATFHEKLAAGSPATFPRGAGRFEGGAGAPAPTDKDLNALAAKARTPAEHRSLEEYFLTVAKRYTADANEHTTLAQTYRGTRIAQAAVHHDRLATLSRDSAKEANEAAAMHKQLANIAR